MGGGELALRLGRRISGRKTKEERLAGSEGKSQGGEESEGRGVRGEKGGKSERRWTGEGGMEKGLPSWRLRQAPSSVQEQTLEFSKNSSAFPPVGLAAGTGERHACPFMVRKIQILRGGAGPESVVLDEAQPWGLEWDSLGGGCDLVGCPGLGSSILCEARA